MCGLADELDVLHDVAVARAAKGEHRAIVIGRSSVNHHGHVNIVECAEADELLLAAYWDGLSTREIATRFGIPDGTAKSRLYYALRGLRDALGDLEVLT